MSYEYKGFTVPVVEQALHQSCDGGNEGDARLSPRLLLDLLQQAARSMQQITHWKQFKLWGQTHHVPLDILCVSTCESVSRTSKSSTRAINEAKSDVSCFSVKFLSCVVSHHCYKVLHQGVNKGFTEGPTDSQQCQVSR